MLHLVKTTLLLRSKVFLNVEKNPHPKIVHSQIISRLEHGIYLTSTISNLENKKMNGGTDLVNW